MIVIVPLTLDSVAAFVVLTVDRCKQIWFGSVQFWQKPCKDFIFIIFLFKSAVDTIYNFVN